jgi:hypothetical protein
MRYILIAAAFMVGGFAASGPALAQQGPPRYEPASPARVGGWCKVITDKDYGTDYFGYYKPCPGSRAMAYTPRLHRYS